MLGKSCMKTFIKIYWKTLLFFMIVGLVGGFFLGLYLLDSYPPEIQQELINQGATELLLGITTGIQSSIYGVVLGAAGIFFAKKIGLWKDEKTITKKPLIITIVFSVLGGLLLILPDLLFFNNYSEAIRDSYLTKPTIAYILASVSYGAVIEEVMLRLFTMSLIAFVFNKILKKEDKPTTTIFVLSNIVSALLFAALHLPNTFILLGSDHLIIFRCFLLNGLFGLLFGYLYRKHGLRYAMIAHGGCHIVSKLIWILFV